MKSVRSTWVMSCISRPVNAIGMAPRPIRRGGLSPSPSLAVKPHSVNLENRTVADIVAADDSPQHTIAIVAALNRLFPPVRATASACGEPRHRAPWPAHLLSSANHSDSSGLARSLALSFSRVAAARRIPVLPDVLQRNSGFLARARNAN